MVLGRAGAMIYLSGGAASWFCQRGIMVSTKSLCLRLKTPAGL